MFVNEEDAEGKERLFAELNRKNPKKISVADSSLVVLDNGSCIFRFGPASLQDPVLCFENVVYKGQPKGSQIMETFFGGDENELTSLYTRLSAKYSFDQNILVNFEVFETELDFAFSQLLKNSGNSAPSIVFTESLGTFDSCRNATNEIFFDGFRCAKVAYGIDCLFSYYLNSNADFSLVVSIGYKCIHVIPIVDGKAHFHNAKRLSIGGFHMQEYLLKLLQIKYPNFPYKLTFTEASLFLYKYCRFAENYLDELKMSLNLESQTFIQFPVPESSPSPSVEEMEQKKQQEMLKKQELAQKMREQAATKRKERLEKFETEMEEFIKLYHMEREDVEHFQKTLEYLEFEDKQDLLNTIVKTRESINGMRQKMGLELLPLDEEFDRVKNTSANIDWSLLDVADGELDDDEIKEKRRLRMIKNSMDAREKAKKQKDLMQEERNRKEEQENELKKTDFKKWLGLLHSKRSAILKQLKTAQKSTSSQTLKEKTVDRVRKMASMIDMDEETATPKKTQSSKSIPNAKRQKKKTKKSSTQSDVEEDSFGKEDADWAVYHEIQLKENDIMEEGDEGTSDNLQEELSRIEEILLLNDPNFSLEQQQSLDNCSVFSVESSELFCKFLYGNSKAPTMNDDWYKIYLNVEKIRVPEVLFQPCMMGIDQCGLSELILGILQMYDSGIRQQLAENIFICGAPCRITGLKTRLHSDISSMLPTEWKVKVTVDSDPLSAWKGAAKWATVNEGKKDRWILSKEDASQKSKYCLY